MSMAGPSAPWLTSCLAAVTYWLPGPNSLSQRGTDSVPAAIAAIACAPPSLNTRMRSPHRRAATSTAGSALPSGRGGVHSTISRQPASTAGVASISAVDGSGAEPAGTYRPTRRIGRTRRPVTTPGPASISQGVVAPAAW